MGAGKKRTITFNQGDSEQEIIEAKGLMKADLAVAISQGLPNTSSRHIISIYTHKHIHKYINICSIIIYLH